MALTEEGLLEIPGMLSRYVRLPGGVKAHYMTSGAAGPAVVLLHGGITGASGQAGWRFMAPFLGENGFRVYCPDLVAFGHTSDPLEFYPIGAPGHVDFIHDFTTALCLDQFFLGGNSMGTANATAYALAHPERVRALALIAGGIGDAAPRVSKGKPTGEFDGTRESMKRLLSAINSKSEVLDEDLLEMRTRNAIRQKEAFDKRWAQMGRMQRGEDSPNTSARLSTKGRLNQLDIPTIYLWGRQDLRMSLEDAAVQEDALPSAQFFYPDDCGHQGQSDQPELFNQVFLEFFRDSKVSGPTARAAGISQRRPPNPDLVAVHDQSEGER